ncbi:cryptochrome/photolyase family protein [Egicoccus halophilus]|uniref:Deoxyribodipyrimidine photo-lyase n=1 Tax=Egicoccus halophilus TaxID=1670830 RepID=A0A8J3A7L7_9ACTN|nr:deoxyribodipyrimidine photo-lyase [Egicoccus halophilus]GGI05570.1 deoxyribodipyrimidine photo-lyase [Egicoccus halophilus]
MTTTVVLFTRDLRVTDHPALAAAAAEADRVVPLFVLDTGILASRYAAPNRIGYLVEALTDLRARLRERGGDLVVRRGDTLAEVVEVCRVTGADRVRLSADHSAHARRRVAGLQARGAEHGFSVSQHPGVTVVAPEAVRPTGGDHFRVFTPYWRRWEAQRRRPLLAPPDEVVLPDAVVPGDLPAWHALVEGERSPEVLTGGETAARERLDAWFEANEVAGYAYTRDRLAAHTSRLSADLHFGCLSPAEIDARVDRRRTGHESFVRQLCWREFNTQLLAANPDLPYAELRGRGDRWRVDEEAFAAWQAGETGYPVVDAGMRQLRREGWMHNRVRLLTASFLTKHLYVDWRLGAWHFMDWLVDGDLANNFAQWQWVAGTGTDSRPNRMFNPVTQGQRFDPDGGYVRAHVPELADLPGGAVHEPWAARDTLFAGVDDGYPAPLVDHAEARERFLSARGR